MSVSFVELSYCSAGSSGMEAVNYMSGIWQKLGYRIKMEKDKEMRNKESHMDG